MLAVSHQPTVYVANQPYYYVQSQSSVPAGQWTTQVVPVSHSGSGYVYSSSYRTQASPTVYAVQPSQQVTRPAAYAVGAPTMKGSFSPMGYVQPPPRQPSFTGQASYQSPVPVVDANDFTPASPVMSESTTTSDDSSGSFSSSASSRYNLPSSAINHYTAPHRPRRRSSISQPRHPEPYAISAEQSSLSLPLPQASQPIYVQSSHQPLTSHNLQSHPSNSSRPQPAFVRNTGRSGNPVSFQRDPNQQVYSSYELYKPTPHRAQPIARPVLHRRASSTALVATGSVLTESSYGSGLGITNGTPLGMAYGDRDTREKKWWRIGR